MKDTQRWVLLVHEARARGFRNALAFRRWCRRRKVPIRADGKFQWVRPAEVDAAVSRLAAGAEASDGTPTTADEAVASTVAALMAKGRVR